MRESRPQSSKESFPMPNDAIPVTIRRSKIDFQDPFSAYTRLSAAFGMENVFLLESISGPKKDVTSSIVGVHPIVFLAVEGTSIEIKAEPPLQARLENRILATGWAVKEPGGGLRMDSRKRVWDILRSVQTAFAIDPGEGKRPGFQFGFFGYFGYDVIHSLEDLPDRRKQNNFEIPEISLAIFKNILYFDHANNEYQCIQCDSPEFPVRPPCYPLPPDVPGEAAKPESTAAEALESVTWTVKKDEYLAKVEKALGYIRIGDIYQVQIGHEIIIRSKIAPLEVYMRLRETNPSPYMYLAKLSGRSIIGASPESFIRIQGSKITMRPIAGTAKRGSTEEEDKAFVQRLLDDEKEDAEHIMLVDLARNDIGKICIPTTLKVTELKVVERYSHVNHLVSNVEAEMPPSEEVFSVIKGTFPAGTMTGTPKIRAMEIIDELETTKRGIYAGCIGLIDFLGDANLALCIRSVFEKNGSFHLRASAGVVADSTPESEWNETINKMAAVFFAVAGKGIRDENPGH
jgi:anthranilate synthase component 1